jgi:hypothetical protein
LRFLLLHSPLLGPFSWAPAAEELRRLGHQADAPAWPRLSSLAGGFYRGLVAGMAAPDAPAVLVAHSGAGALVPALAAALGDKAAAAVFCDALLPHPGRSWFDTAPDDLQTQLRAGVDAGRLPAWDRWWPPGALEQLLPDEKGRQRLVRELEAVPAAYFEEPAPDAALEVPCGYLQLSGAYNDEARLAGRQGWPVVSLPLNHLAIVSQPSAVAAALEGLAARLLP